MSFPASELLAVNMAQQGHCHDSEVTAPGACATIVDPLQSLTRRHSQAIRGRGDLLHPCTRPVSYVPQPSGDRTQFVNPVREIRSMAPRGARVQRGGRDEGSRGGVTDVVRFFHIKCDDSRSNQRCGARSLERTPGVHRAGRVPRLRSQRQARPSLPQPIGSKGFGTIGRRVFEPRAALASRAAFLVTRGSVSNPRVASVPADH